MKKSEIFRQAQIAVLDADMPISMKTEVLSVLMWEAYFAKVAEENQKENADETF